MTTLTEQAAFAQSIASEFAGQLRAACVTAAVSILNEDPTTPLHDERHALAMVCVRNPGAVTDAFAWAVSTNPTVTDKWTAGEFDSAFNDFGFVLSTVWDSVATSWAAQ